MSRPSLPGAALGILIFVSGMAPVAVGAPLPGAGTASYSLQAGLDPDVAIGPVVDARLRSADASDERLGPLNVLGVRLTGAPPWIGRRQRRERASSADIQRLAQANGVIESQPALKGLMVFEAGGARFTDCRSGRAYPLAEDGDFEALEHAYLAAGQEPGGPLMVSFEGFIDDMPRPDGGGDEPTVLVERFVGVWPDETCDQALGDATLKNTEWAIRRLGRTDLPDRARNSWLLLDEEENRFSATVGCNQLVGAFNDEDMRLSFGPAAATMMACREPVKSWEDALNRTLETTAAYRIQGATLELLDGNGNAIAAFEARYHY